MGPTLPLLIVALATCSVADGSDAPEVSVTAGRLRGKWTTTRGLRPIAAFEGIPYAEPPVAELRFQPPVPAKPWSGVRDATQPSAMCIQRNVFMRAQDIEGSEDCLYINVYAPEAVSRTKPLPVLFWVHGGGFVFGTGFIYGPEYLLDHDVVFVSFNYRLGPLGFVSTGDGVLTGNYGMKDQVLALKWVQENIRAFGGDPDQVTIFGESAGGASVHLLTLSPLTKGLFHRAVPMSGSALAPWAFHSPDVAKERAAKLADLLGCPAEPSEQLKQCLMAKSAEDITSTDKGFEQWLIHPMIPFKVTTEAPGPDAFLDKHPDEVYAAGAARDIPFMTGFTSHEGCIGVVPIVENPGFLEEFDERYNELAPIIFYADHYAKDVNKEIFSKIRKFYFGEGRINNDAVPKFTDFISDSLFVYSALETVKLQKKFSKSPVFLYEVAHTSQRSFALTFGAKAAKYGVCHADDLLHIFPLKSLFPQEPSSEDNEFSTKLVDFLVNFATIGRPTKDDSWREVTNPEKAEYIRLASPSDISMRSNFSPDRMKLWAELPLPIATSRSGSGQVDLRDEL